MNIPEIGVLIEKYLNSQATEEERKLVDAWYESFELLPGATAALNAETLQASMKLQWSALQKVLPS